MNSQPSEESSVDSLRRKGQEIVASTQNCAADAFAEIEYQVRRNPWVFIGGAVVVGLAVAALVSRPRREPKKLEIVRDWLRDAYEGVAARVPDRDEVQAAVRSTVRSIDFPGRIDGIRKRLNFD